MLTRIKRVATRGALDWLLQRVSAVILAVYTVWMLSYFLAYSPIAYDTWFALWSRAGIKWATCLVLVSILIHAWIGLWTVFTDYIKPLYLRWIIEILVIGLLLSYVLWVIVILWC